MTDTKTQTTGASGGVQMPQIPDGQTVYDWIMSRIEPELTTAQKDKLPELYKNETPEQAQVRAQRYTKAFEEYDKQYAQYRSAQESSVHTFQRSIMSGVEARARGREEGDMSNLEDQIQNA